MSKKPYRHEGGGCTVQSRRCDDVYSNRNGTKVITVYSNMDAHFSMPQRITGAAQLRRMKGVRSVKVKTYKTGGRR